MLVKTGRRALLRMARASASAAIVALLMSLVGQENEVDNSTKRGDGEIETICYRSEELAEEIVERVDEESGGESIFPLL
jgi:hypothetical protein